MDRRRILLIAAACVAAVGTLLVFLYVRGADARAEERFDTIPVLRAIAPIEPGETIEAASANGKLELQPVPRGQLLPDYQSSIDGLKGLVAITRVYPGEQIIASKFGGQADAASPLQIPKGQLAISVNLTDPARVAGFVNPGSEVAIFLNGVDEASGQPFTRLLLNRVTVLGVGSTTPVSTTTTDPAGGQTTEQLPRTLLTLALDETDAQRVLFASGNGELAFGLLTGTSKVDVGPAVTALNLFE
jgi:pilus assembly protein CpaB